MFFTLGNQSYYLHCGSFEWFLYKLMLVFSGLEVLFDSIALNWFLLKMSKIRKITLLKLRKRSALKMIFHTTSDNFTLHEHAVSSHFIYCMVVWRSINSAWNGAYINSAAP